MGVGGVFRAHLAELVHLVAVLRDAGIELRHALARQVALADRLGVRRAWSTGGGEQQLALGTDPVDHVVALAAGDFADRLFQRFAQMVGGMPHRLGDVLCAALFDPQQPRDAPVFRTARALAGKPETQQFCQMLLRVLAVERLRPDPEFTALALQETLAQAVVGAANREVQLDGRSGRRLAPGQQVVHAGRAMALEKSRADGPHQGALADLVRAGEQIQPRCKARQFERLAKLPQ